MGFVAFNQKALWHPEYGQGFWWSWGNAFVEAPENIIFIIGGVVAWSIILAKDFRDTELIKGKDESN